MTYQEFLATPFWDMMRKERLRRDNHKCQNCGSKENLHVHHRVYCPDWFQVKPDELATLCKQCHEKVHSGKLPEFLKLEKAFDWRGDRIDKRWVARNKKKKRAQRRAMARKFGRSF